MLPRTHLHLDGPPWAWPTALDRVAEAWWSARPRVRVLLAALLVILTVLVGVLHAAAAPGGPPTRVYIATRDLQPGDPVTSGDVERLDWPADLVPEDAVDQPTGSLRALVPRGAVLTHGHVGEHAIAAAISSGQVAVPVPVDLAPDIGVGSAVDLIGPGPDGSGERLAADARVVGADASAIWIGLDPDAAIPVSAAIGNGTLAVAVRATPSR